MTLYFGRSLNFYTPFPLNKDDEIVHVTKYDLVTVNNSFI